MPNRILVIIVSSLLFSSCQKKMGGFQKSSRESFSQTKRVIPSINIEKEIKKELNNEPTFDELETADYTVSSNEGLKGYIETNQKPIFSNFKSLKETKKNNVNVLEKKQNLESKKPSKKKKRKKRNSVFNDGVKIGIVFLIIAILLSFLHITQLVILFGLVSVLFLYLGLKKYMRRNRLKNIFK